MKYLNTFNESLNPYEEEIADIKDVFQDLIDEYDLEKNRTPGLTPSNGISYYYQYSPQYYDSLTKKISPAFEIFLYVQYNHSRSNDTNAGIEVLRSNEKTYKKFQDMRWSLVKFYQRIRQMGFQVRITGTSNNNPLRITIKLE